MHAAIAATGAATVSLLLAEGGDAPDVLPPHDGSPSRREVEAAVFLRLAQDRPSATPAAVCRSAIEVLRTTSASPEGRSTWCTRRAT